MPPVTAVKTAPETIARERAADFERRGVLDRAARAFRELFEQRGDPAHLAAAAELYERALSLPFAAECYAELARSRRFRRARRRGSEA